MSFAATIAAASEGASHVVNELPMPAFLFGAIVLGIFVVLAIATYSFRDVANRHAEKAAAYAREHGEAQQH
ncbi:hypothetical protein [Leucobacter denitrificans]|uniref:4-hydroxybenzoate polyprenyltransferase n=1 Tax=Leucobacter denitrificans TaxID=683042 RepID=A0A7G9S5Z8_9MICO|nr:hypothetical protein [Leucobacter denitrificans]QNN63273.1 hypothetical protein H9L06_02730 [Leucobacter denitrificans]